MFKKKKFKKLAQLRKIFAQLTTKKSKLTRTNLLKKKPLKSELRIKLESGLIFKFLII